MKKLLYLLFLLVATSAVAQDVISLKFGYHEATISFTIKATEGETFTINWGDGYGPETFIGKGDLKIVLYRNYWEINSLNIMLTASANCRFTYFDCSPSYNKIITILDVSNCTALTYLNCRGHQLSNLDISNCTALTYLDCSWTLLTNLDFSLNKLTSLDLSNNTALEYLDCSDNLLTNLDLSNNTALEYLDCSDNLLTNLDISNNMALTYLNCSWTQLTNLDVSTNTALTYLDCGTNQLTHLDVNNNTALTVLVCGVNQLTNLDLSNNTALTDLVCGGNQLTNLDLSNNTALIDLGFSGNQLTNLDLSNNTALTALNCCWNQLTYLDISNNTALTYLICSNNQLTNLDISNNTALTYLICSNNQLTNLDISNNIALRNFDCSENQLINLTLNKNIVIQYFYCYDNQLSSLNLDFDCVDYIYCYNNKFALSDLYDFYRKVLAAPSDSRFGTQTLMPQTVNVGDTLFSEQAVFDGIFTNYAVTQNDISVSESEYKIIEGKLIFNTAGDYTVTMTNEIFENLYIPTKTKVVIELIVLNKNSITENNKSNIQIYPNPTNGQLTIRNEELGITNYNIEIFDITNRKIFTQKITNETEQIIDISHLQSGIYFLKIDKEIFKIIKN